MKLEKVIAVRTSKTIYRDGKYAIKVFDEGYSKADILNEALNIARVEETGLSIPGVEEVTKIDGKWAIVTDYAEGKTIAQLMAEDPDKKDEYLERFVDIQMEIHSKTAPMLNKLKDKMKRKISQTGLDATTRYELDSRLESMPKHNKLCHSDFNPTNVVISKDGESYSILDWAHATRGNASADAARTSAVLAQRRYRFRGEVSESLLQEERYCQAVCTEVAADCSRLSVCQRETRGKRVPDALG